MNIPAEFVLAPGILSKVACISFDVYIVIETCLQTVLNVMGSG